MRIPGWLWKLAVALALLAGVALAYLSSLQMFASDPVSQTRNGAIDGYDPVAYFEAGEPIRGDSRHQYEWNGATWSFATEAHRAAFAADPERYAPQFGGYCAYAVGNGYTAKPDPEAWHIEEGRLYLNFDESTQKSWLADRANLIASGQRNWPRVIND
jgi:YHS domain-containing protein